MIDTSELDKIAHGRLEDAKALLGAGRYDGAAYLCGYAVEIALKATICRTLQWSGYPGTSSEFQNLISFRTHILDVLLTLCGQNERIRTDHFPLWSAVSKWSVESRYNRIGTASEPYSRSMIDSAEKLMEVL